VASKYAPLGDYLRTQYADEVPMTFGRIEQVIGAALPPLAQHSRGWWSNNAANNVMTRVWLDAGFRTERVDLERRTLVFRRIAAAASGAGHELREPSAVYEVATMAKKTHHPLFGALQDVTFLVEGVDLTLPADPDWADLVDQKRD